jgi:hypothetical protein
MQNTTNYTDTVTACTNAVRQDINTVNKWQTAGDYVRAFFGTEAAMLEVKAQFIADAILPAIDKRHAKALSTELVRKNSKEFLAYDAGQRDSWEAANQAKKDARATCDTYFARIVKYAFPKEATPAEARTLETRINEEVTALIKACQKADAPSFDVQAVIASLQNVLTVVNK